MITPGAWTSHTYINWHSFSKQPFPPFPVASIISIIAKSNPRVTPSSIDRDVQQIYIIHHKVSEYDCRHPQ